jgi:protein-tyrosine phosphatase
MAAGKTKTVLFLCTGNYYRSRFAESLFNSVAGKMGLSWRASSRGLALERGVNNDGSMAVAAIAALKKMGIAAECDCDRPPMRTSTADLEQADRIVALKHAEHQPLLQERYPAWVEKTEYWNVDDAPEALALIEREIMGLVARILGGGNRPDTPDTQSSSARAAKATVEPPKKPVTAKVGRETAGRRGKGVTTVFDLPLGEGGLRDLATTLKQRCGTGGTVKDGRIEIQGDQRDRITAELERLGYRVKRAGG